MKTRLPHPLGFLLSATACFVISVAPLEFLTLPHCTFICCHRTLPFFLTELGFVIFTAAFLIRHFCSVTSAPSLLLLRVMPHHEAFHLQHHAF